MQLDHMLPITSRAASPAVRGLLDTGIKCTILVTRSTTVIMESSPSAVATGKSVSQSRRLLLAIWLLEWPTTGDFPFVKRVIQFSPVGRLGSSLRTI